MPRENLEMLQKVLSLHSKPQELLNEMLHDVMELFKPQGTDQAINYLIEYLVIASKIAALILGDHASDHPERSKECVPELLTSFQEVFERLIHEHFQVLVDRTDLFDPFAQPDTNRQTYEDIMASLKQGHDDGKA